MLTSMRNINFIKCMPVVCLSPLFVCFFFFSFVCSLTETTQVRARGENASQLVVVVVFLFCGTLVQAVGVRAPVRIMVLCSKARYLTLKDASLPCTFFPGPAAVAQGMNNTIHRINQKDMSECWEGGRNFAMNYPVD